MTACDSQQTAFIKRIEASFAELDLARSERPLLLMVSGGSDSTALVRLAASICGRIAANSNESGGGGKMAASSSANDARKNGSSSANASAPGTIRVLHVNHLLRGKEANADERFVVKLCAALGVACVVERVDVAAQAAKTKESIEQAGRRLRYELAEAALDELCVAAGRQAADGRILTAHTADDRAETLLQRLIVGGGSGSLASIPRQNGRVVRPLLNYTRDELRGWLVSQDASCGASPDTSAGCSPDFMSSSAFDFAQDAFPGKTAGAELWREDASNLDTTRSRAFVRHELLPLLAARNPRIIQSLGKTAQILTDESAWMDELARGLLPLTSASFAAPLPQLRRAIYLACNQAIARLAPDARITFEHVELIARAGSRKGFACQIPGGIEVRNERGTLTFAKAKSPNHDPRD
jgi:tRNA(Ile)-lysidine synthase